MAQSSPASGASSICYVHVLSGNTTYTYYFHPSKTGGSDANRALIANRMERNFLLPSHSSLLPCHRYRYRAGIMSESLRIGPRGILGVPGWCVICSMGHPSESHWLSGIYVAFLYKKMALPVHPLAPST